MIADEGSRAETYYTIDVDFDVYLFARQKERSKDILNIAMSLCNVMDKDEDETR